MAAVTTFGTKHRKEYELCITEFPDSSQNAATSGTAKEGQSQLKTGVNQTSASPGLSAVLSANESPYSGSGATERSAAAR